MVEILTIAALVAVIFLAFFVFIVVFRVYKALRARDEIPALFSKARIEQKPKNGVERAKKFLDGRGE